MSVSVKNIRLSAVCVFLIPVLLLVAYSAARYINTDRTKDIVEEQSGISEDETRLREMLRPVETVFSRIVDRKAPGNILFEDDVSMAFDSNNPLAPVHFLVIPKRIIPMFSDTTDEDQQLLGHLMNVARKVAAEQGLENGYRIVLNNGPDGAQAIYHMHIHVLGGRQMGWPPG